MDAKTHVSHGLAGLVGGAAFALIAAVSGALKPTPVAPQLPHIAGWHVDAGAIINALKPFKPTFVEIVCGTPQCQQSADAISDAAAKQGISAGVVAPIGQVPAGFIVSGGRNPDAGAIANAIWKATGETLPIAYTRWAFYTRGSVTLSFGRLK